MSIPFQKPSLEEIQALIQKELKEIPLENLSIKLTDQRELMPIYQNSKKTLNVPNLLDYKVIFQLFSLNHSEAKKNNQTLLKALENGQNGLILDFQNQKWSLEDMENLFINIRLDYVHTEFLNLNVETEKHLETYIKNYPHPLEWSNVKFSNEVFCISDDSFYRNAANFIKSFGGNKAFIHIELSGDYFRDIAKIRAFKSMLCQHRKLFGICAAISLAA